jgi:hypothetical protein
VASSAAARSISVLVSAVSWEIIFAGAAIGGLAYFGYNLYECWDPVEPLAVFRHP